MITLLLLSQPQVPSPQADPPAPIRYQVTATVSPDRTSLDARAVIQVDRAVLGNPDSIRVALGGPGLRRLLLTARPLLDGRETAGHASADSTELVLPAGREAVSALSLAYRIVLDTMRRRQLGYDLFASTDSDDAWYPAVVGITGPAGRFRDFEVRLSTAKGLAVLTSGTVLDSTTRGSIVQRHERAAHLEGFALAMAAGYVVRRHASGGIHLQVLSPPGDTLIWDRVAGDRSEERRV